MEYQDTEMAKTKYLNTEDLTPLLNEESFSLLQANFSSSLCCPEELHSLFNENKIEIIGITESRIRHTFCLERTLNKPLLKRLMGLGVGGWGELMHIRNYLKYSLRNDDLYIFKKGNLN